MLFNFTLQNIDKENNRLIINYLKLKTTNYAPSKN